MLIFCAQCVATPWYVHRMFVPRFYSFLFFGRIQTLSMLVFNVLSFLCIGLHVYLSCQLCIHQHGPTNVSVAALEISLQVSRPMYCLIRVGVVFSLLACLFSYSFCFHLLMFSSRGQGSELTSDVVSSLRVGSFKSVSDSEEIHQEKFITKRFKTSSDACVGNSFADHDALHFSDSSIQVVYSPAHCRFQCPAQISTVFSPLQTQ